METESKQPENLSQIVTRKNQEAEAAGISSAPVKVVEKQVNAPGRQYPGVASELPYDITLDETKIEIDSMDSAMAADPNGHPLWNKGHPLNKSYRKRRSDLYEKKAALEADEYHPDPMEELQEKRAQKEGKIQARRCQLAEMEMKELVKRGKDSAEIPPNISENIYQLLRAQNLYAQEKYLEGDIIARNVARELNVSLSEMQAHFDLRNVTYGQEDKQKAADRILFYLKGIEKKRVEDLEKLKEDVRNKIENPTERFRYL